MVRKQSFPQWKGFEKVPDGCLLEQLIDLSPALGVAYERCSKYYKDFHEHDRLMLIFPRGSSSMEVRTKAPAQRYTIDAGTILFVPKGLEHDDEGMTSIYDTMALYPTPAVIQKAAETIGLMAADVEKLSRGCVKVKRNKALDRLVDDYFYRRILSRAPASDEDVDYLGRRILEESFRAAFPKAKVAGEPVRPLSGEDPLHNALRFMESNLFESLSVEEIARRSGASPSSLLRKFKAELGTTPYRYLRDRRLEEALSLLKAGDRPVGEIALLVGYENFGAFSEAFKAKYGRSPSRAKA